MSPAPVTTTERLVLRRVELDDAPFIMELVNEPGWLQYIGDKNVRSLDDAHRYLRSGPLDSYERHGFGLYLVQRRSDGEPIGTCGLIKRDALDHPDIGFAFLARVGGQGYAYEAAAAVKRYAASLGVRTLLAITTPTNDRSQRLLGKIGLRFDREITMPPSTEVLHLFIAELT